MKGLALLGEPVRNFCRNENAAYRITRRFALDQGSRRASGPPTLAAHMPAPTPRLTRPGLPEQPGNLAQKSAQENEGGQNANCHD